MLSAMLLEVALVAFGGIGQASPAAEPPTRSGFPPFGLFHSEYGIVRAALAEGQAWVAVVLVVLLGVTFVGMAANVLAMAQGPPGAAAAADRGPVLTVFMPLVLALGVVGLGVYLPPRLDAAGVPLGSVVPAGGDTVALLVTLLQ